jgi:hypothetical protein
VLLCPDIILEHVGALRDVRQVRIHQAITHSSSTRSL